MLAISFDDGPDPRWTACVLATLSACRARATFFMVGERVAAGPRAARAVVDAGHDVQLHCYRHRRHSELTRAEIEEDARAGLVALAAIGVRATRWRTPWGIEAESTAEVAREHGLELVGWTIDTHDWRGDTAAEMLAKAQGALDDGAVVLMHDSVGPGSRREGCANTVGLLAPLIDAARARGLEVGPVGS